MNTRSMYMVIISIVILFLLKYYYFWLSGLLCFCGCVMLMFVYNTTKSYTLLNKLCTNRYTFPNITYVAVVNNKKLKKHVNCICAIYMLTAYTDI